MSGGGQTQTTTQNSEPYEAAKPLLDRGMGDALSLYSSGGLVKPTQTNTVVPYSNQTTQGMGALQTMANANMGGQGVSGQYQGILDNGGYNAEQKTALGGIQDTATSSFDPYGNPAFRQVLDQALEGSMMGVNSNAAAMGRYGSGTHQGVMQREQGDLAARMIGGEYNNWQNRRDGAQQQLFNAGQQGIGNLATAYEGQQAPIDTLMGVGSMYEDLYGRTINDRLSKEQERNNLGLANIQALLSATGYGQPYATQTQRAQMPGSLGSNIAGGLLGGLSLLNL